MQSNVPYLETHIFVGQNRLNLIRQPDAAMMERIYRLRVSAWRARTPHFPNIPEWRDDFDTTAMHWAIVSNGTPIAAARMTIHDRLADVPSAEIYDGVVPDTLAGPIACITRMVVHPDWGGKGLPKILDMARIDAAQNLGCRHMIGQTYAGLSRVQAMRELGFEIVGQAAQYKHGPLAQVKNDRGGGGTCAASSTFTDDLRQTLGPTCLVKALTGATRSQHR